MIEVLHTVGSFCSWLRANVRRKRYDMAELEQHLSAMEELVKLDNTFIPRLDSSIIYISGVLRIMKNKQDFIKFSQFDHNNCFEKLIIDIARFKKWQDKDLVHNCLPDDIITRDFLQRYRDSLRNLHENPYRNYYDHHHPHKELANEFFDICSKVEEGALENQGVFLFLISSIIEKLQKHYSSQEVVSLIKSRIEYEESLLIKRVGAIMEFDCDWEARFHKVNRLVLGHDLEVDFDKIPFLEAVYMNKMITLTEAVRNKCRYDNQHSKCDGKETFWKLQRKWNLQQKQFEFELSLIYQELGYTSYFGAYEQDKALLLFLEPTTRITF